MRDTEVIQEIKLSLPQHQPSPTECPRNGDYLPAGMAFDMGMSPANTQGARNHT
jgi:hypothetical protein